MKALLNWLFSFLYRSNPIPVEGQKQPKETPKVPKRTEELYSLSKSKLGQHLSMDESIPWGVGCAQAVSRLLSDFGVKTPSKGIPGTSALAQLLRESLKFKKVDSPSLGRIIVSETGTGNGKIRGHIGVCAEDGIIHSNNSETGKWDSHWTLKRWKDYYQTYGLLRTSYFEPI